MSRWTRFSGRTILYLSACMWGDFTNRLDVANYFDWWVPESLVEGAVAADAAEHLPSLHPGDGIERDASGSD